MADNKFLARQESRIKKRIAACERAIKGGRIDAIFKAQRVLPSQRLALQRLRMGLYGQCIECGDSIEKKRLQAVPAAIRCVDCQNEAED